MATFKQRIRQLTRRSAGRGMEEVVQHRPVRTRTPGGAGGADQR